MIDPSLSGTANESSHLFLDWLWRPVVDNWPLVAIGLGGVIAALRTLSVIRVQAETMIRQTEIAAVTAKGANDSASAALRSAEALFNSERPWLVVLPEKKAEIFRFGVYNRGRTPANIVEGSSTYTFAEGTDDLPRLPDYSKPFIMPNLSFIVGGDSFPILPHSDPESIVENSVNKDMVKQSRLFLIFYGRVVYTDVLTGTTNHETRWCFAYLPHEKGFVRFGPKEYNGYT